MQKLLIFLAIFQLFYFVSCTDEEDEEFDLSWVYTKDFKPSELSNLSPEDEHRLMINTLTSKKDASDLGAIMYWEVLAKSSGLEFCGILATDEKDQENSAITRAAFDYMTKLEYFDRASKIVSNSFMKNFMGDLLDYDFSYSNATDVAKAYAKICSSIDERLKNEEFYAKLKDQYLKEMSSSPPKKYLYSIPKSEAELRKELAAFANDRKLKRTSAHIIFLYKSDEAEEKWPAKKILRSLAKLPGKSGVVQKIYDQSIETITRKLKKISEEDVDVDTVFERDTEKYAKTLFKLLRKKVIANNDLQSQVLKWVTPLCKPSTFFDDD